MAVEITFTRRADKSISKIEKSDRRVFEALKQRFKKLAENPEPPDSKPMKGYADVRATPFHGDYGRIIYRIVSDEEIKILMVGSREEIYPQLKAWRASMF